MVNAVAIFLGGGLGCLVRYLISVLLRMNSLNFPVATFSVNIVGSLVLGFIAALYLRQPELHPTVRLALGVGFCGGLTTFSTFSLETFEMIKNGALVSAIFYIFVSVLVCLLAVALGAFLTRYV